MMSLRSQFAYLLLIALPIACASWTVTHEEVFREPREYCKDKSQNCKSTADAEVFLPLSPVSIASVTTSRLSFLIVTRFRMLYGDWRGYLISWFALVWIANVYMSLFNRLRLDIKHENVTIAVDQTKVEKAV